MLRSVVAKGALLVAVVSVPVGAVAASSDDTVPDETVPVDAAEGSAPESSPPDDTIGDTDGDEGGSGPPVDIEFQIDMMLGLVPEDEMNEYYSEQSQEQELEIQACMNEAGFEYNPQDTGDMVSFDQYNGMSQLEWAQQWGFGMWTSMDPENNPYDTGNEFVWSNDEIINELSEAERNAWFEVNNRCSNDVWSNAENDPFRNPEVQQAMEDFNTMVENDPRMREAQETWVDCMADAGHPFADQEAMWNAVYGEMDDNMELQNQFYESEAWDPSSPDHAQWQQLVDEEIEIAVADATCSPPYNEVREEVQKDLRPDLVAVWQTIDWSLPPVTYPFEDEMFGPDGEPIDDDVAATDTIPDNTEDDGGGLDLGEPVETTEP